MPRDAVEGASTARLPPFNLFRTFDAAARHCSFRTAAQELCITPSAVSQRIHQLEVALGVRLFRRLPRRVELTRQGTSLANTVQEALAMLNTACSQLAKEPSKPTITVSVAPGLASFWLVPRLPEFRELHPEVNILLQASNDRVDFARQDVDIAVRWGNGIWSDAQATQLAKDTIFPVCSPEFRDRHHLHDLQGLQQVTQLHVMVQGNTWTDWLAAAGHGSIAFRDVQYFSDATLMLRAATQGHGIAICSYLLAENDLLSNRLVRPFDVDLEISESYYILTSAYADEQPAIGWFRDWMQEQARLSLSRRTR